MSNEYTASQLVDKIVHYELTEYFDEDKPYLRLEHMLRKGFMGYNNWTLEELRELALDLHLIDE